MKSLVSFAFSLLLLSISASAPALAQKIDIDSVQVQLQGSNVKLSFSMNVPSGTIKGNYDLVYTPRIIQGQNQLTFPSIAFTGLRKQLSDARKSAMLEESALQNTKIQGSEGQISYEQELPYEQWLSQGPNQVIFDRSRESYTKRVALDRIVSDSTYTLHHPWSIWTPELTIPDTTTLTINDLLCARAAFFANRGQYAEALQTLTSLTASDENTTALKAIWQIAMDSTLRAFYFPIMHLSADSNRYVITLSKLEPTEQAPTTLSLYFGVKDTLLLDIHKEQLNAALQSSVQNHHAQPHITIVSAASPEGFPSLNSRLSQGRANQTISYISEWYAQHNMTLVDSLLSATSIGNDWENLTLLIQEDEDMPYRDESLTVIANTSERNRIHKLWGLKWGVPYTYLMKHIFPQLRTCHITIYPSKELDANGKTINQAIDLINEGAYVKALELLYPLQEDTRAEIPLSIAKVMNGISE